MTFKVFIAGGNGLVGKAVRKAFLQHSYKDILVPRRNELDLLEKENTLNWLIHYKPEIIILCAAKVGGIDANRNAPVDFLLKI